MMIPQPRTILRQRNEILHHPDVDSITAPLHPHTMTWEHHDDTPATNRYTRTASTSTPNITPSTRYNQSSIHPPQTACPLAPGRQARKAASTSTPNCMPLAPGQLEKTKQHPPAPQTACPQHPAVKLEKQHPPAPETACPRAPGRQARRPARKPAAPHPAVKLAKQHLPAPQTACPVAPAKQHPPAPPTA